MTATFAVEPTFWLDFDALSAEEQSAFLAALDRFIDAAEHTPGRFPPELRVRRRRRMPYIWQLSWSAEGRALLRCEYEHRPIQHYVWLRIGGPAILG